MIEHRLGQIHVDREQELEVFMGMKSRALGAHVLFIEAESGMGKSALLTEIWDACHEVRRARVNLKAAALTCEQVMQLLVAQLRGDYPNFSRHLEAVSRSADIHIHGGALLMSSVKVNIGETEDRVLRMQRTLLTHALVDDLRLSNPGLSPIVVTIDTFDQGTLELRDWISGILLPAVIPLPWLVLVIAGQKSPAIDEDSADSCMHTRLKTLDRASIREYIRKVEDVTKKDLSLTDEGIRVLHVLTQGRPALLVTNVRMLFFEQGFDIG